MRLNLDYEDQGLDGLALRQYSTKKQMDCTCHDCLAGPAIGIEVIEGLPVTISMQCHADALLRRKGTATGTVRYFTLPQNHKKN